MWTVVPDMGIPLAGGAGINVKAANSLFQPDRPDRQGFLFILPKKLFIIFLIIKFFSPFHFNTQLTLSTFLQYNSTGEIGVLNARFRYNPRDGNNFYLVFNESINTNRDMLTPMLPVSDNRAVLLKFDYTF